MSRVSRVWKLHGLALQSCSVAWPTKAANKKVKLIIAGITQHGASYLYEDEELFMYHMYRCMCWVGGDEFCSTQSQRIGC